MIEITAPDQSRLHSGPPTGATLFVLLPPCTVVALMGLRNALANYQLGVDGQLHLVGGLMMGGALLAGIATAASAQLRLPARRRWVLLLVAVTLLAVALLWGLPAEAQARAVAHVCACEGG